MPPSTLTAIVATLAGGASAALARPSTNTRRIEGEITRSPVPLAASCVNGSTAIGPSHGCPGPPFQTFADEVPSHHTGPDDANPVIVVVPIDGGEITVHVVPVERLADDAVHAIARIGSPVTPITPVSPWSVQVPPAYRHNPPPATT